MNELLVYLFDLRVDRRCHQRCSIKKVSLKISQITQLFSCEIWEILKKTYFQKQRLLLKRRKMQRCIQNPVKHLWWRFLSGFILDVWLISEYWFLISDFSLEMFGQTHSFTSKLSLYIALLLWFIKNWTRTAYK